MYSIAEDRFEPLSDPNGTPDRICRRQHRMDRREQGGRRGSEQPQGVRPRFEIGSKCESLPGIPVPGDFTIGDGGRTVILSSTQTRVRHLDAFTRRVIPPHPALSSLYANSTQRHGMPGHWWKPWTKKTGAISRKP